MGKSIFAVFAFIIVGFLAFAQVYNKSHLTIGETYYVRTEKLNLRNSTAVSKESIVGTLTVNDQVRVLDLLDERTPLVKVEVIKSKQPSNGYMNEFFVAAEYLQKSAVVSTLDSPTLSKYIVIQNVATERMRVYERCTVAPGCPHRLVMETEMVVGRTEGPKKERDRFLTWVGRYKITEWKKFYQDSEAHYPSWYDPNYPELPKIGSGGSTWLSKKYLPNKEGVMRGAFGWYAAMVGPNANSQWIHGTLGWGADGDKFIDYTRGTFVNWFGNPRSSGCTRIENRAVAYLRSLLSVGTEVYRVYAREAYRDIGRYAYENQKTKVPWEYILTKEAVRQTNPPPADKTSVLDRLSRNKITSSDILEEGFYEVDQYPDALGLMEKADSFARMKAISGNTYNIPDSDFRGAYLVDEGRFVDYDHPQDLTVGGFQNRETPDYLRTVGSYAWAKAVRKSKNQQN